MVKDRDHLQRRGPRYPLMIVADAEGAKDAFFSMRVLIELSSQPEEPLLAIHSIFRRCDLSFHRSLKNHSMRMVTASQSLDQCARNVDSMVPLSIYG